MRAAAGEKGRGSGRDETELERVGVAVVGELPNALPDPAVPDVDWADLVDLLPAALGIMVVSTEAVGAARALAIKDGYAIDANRELYALGGSTSSPASLRASSSRAARARRRRRRTPAARLSSRRCSPPC